MRRFPLVWAAYFIFGCATASVPDLGKKESQIRVGKTHPGPNYEEIGPIEGTNGHGCGGLGAKGTFDGAVSALKIKAARVGASFVQIDTMIEPHHEPMCLDNQFVIRGTAFRIPQVLPAPGPLPSPVQPRQLVLSPATMEDRSAPLRPSKQYASIMVLPPTGSERGQVGELVEVERLLLNSGFKVISSGVTGRVVTTGQTAGAAPMSDLERALVLARTSHADALLQIAKLDWEPSSRSFVADGGGPYREVERGTPVSNSSSVVRVHVSPSFMFKPA